MEARGRIKWRPARKKKRAPCGSPFSLGGGSVVVELGDGLADGGLVQELLLVDEAGRRVWSATSASYAKSPNILGVLLFAS